MSFLRKISISRIFPRKKGFTTLNPGVIFLWPMTSLKVIFRIIVDFVCAADLARKTSRWGSSLIGDSLISVGVILWLIDPSLLIVSGVNNNYKLDLAKSFFTLTLFAQIRILFYINTFNTDWHKAVKFKCFDWLILIDQLKAFKLKIVTLSKATQLIVVNEIKH